MKQVAREGMKILSEIANCSVLGPPRLLDSQASCHAVAATLKQFFRELPDPLLTFALYDRWMNTAGTIAVSQHVCVVSLHCLQQVLQALPILVRVFMNVSTLAPMVD